MLRQLLKWPIMAAPPEPPAREPSELCDQRLRLGTAGGAGMTPVSRLLHNSVRWFTTEPVIPQQRPLVHYGAGYSTTAAVGSLRSRLLHNSVRHAGESRRLVGMTSFGQIPARASLGRNDGEQGTGTPASRLVGVNK